MTPDTLEEALRLRIARLRMMIFDVDGVLTDGRIIYLDDGSEIKVFDVQDGHGIKLLQRAGFEVALLSGRYCRAVEQRGKGLGISRIYQGEKVKIEAYESILRDTGLKDEEVGFMGDDLIDIPVMRRVGFAVAVPNASPHVLAYAHHVTRAAGGHGACREVCELILHVQGLWNTVTMRYFGTDPPS
ncbi:KdsC family phosphatase [Syntrophobacter fumaroxidans]|uniref:3-deoxy-D-manno-octulosonate 8-phosphate phosphatase, YrbI family n=1 Tax=Syntrophobacter fumaroxidans (strain DSM 10017 / MPOB) TaxID=335543 RepID=A0LK04_SYNFM|nr:HAD hydrolase family protein [Syntrophobacter fumaroxidans]ABK17756.1 3-deoxy-D-manno-octulosonate 8-phosphate phosphatase, YrbI family [Syntrophobacter fumaroxidans MPOB]